MFLYNEEAIILYFKIKKTENNYGFIVLNNYAFNFNLPIIYFS
jgi:hypothetical protein